MITFCFSSYDTNWSYHWMLLLTDRWMNMVKQVGFLQNLLLKHAYKYQIIYPIGANVSVFHQSCPPLIQQY